MWIWNTRLRARRALSGIVIRWRNEIEAHVVWVQKSVLIVQFNDVIMYATNNDSTRQTKLSRFKKNKLTGNSVASVASSKSPKKTQSI